ncbi:ATP-grasp domain-containing protein [Streptomyces sp. bgisy100]|uniref:carboxylate--amine ligase n=1 Tax=Streptomyces sp. bgisy100 TaxID=3413783 RepID=UPI003D7072AE
MHHDSAAHPAPRPTFDTGVPALLLRLDDNPFHHGTLGAVRSLGRAGIEVHTLVESPGSPVNRSRFLHRAHHWPGGGPSLERLYPALRRIARHIGRPAVLIPMDDISAIAADRIAPHLDGSYLMVHQSTGLSERVADKAQLAELCRTAGICHPLTVVPGSGREAAGFARDLGLPVVAKWSRPWLLSRTTGLRSTTLVHTPDQARALYEHSAHAGSPLLLQQHIPGGRGTDWFFHGCFGAESVCLVGGTGRKELAWPVRTGLTAVGTWFPNLEVERAALGLAQRLGYRGILDLDFRRDTTTGRYHLLDFNPRPGAQFRLFTDRAGQDVVRALHLDLTGRPVTAAEPLPGRVFVAENYALLSGLTTAATARLRRDTVRRPGRGTRRRTGETAWFAADDPAPFAAMAAGWLGRGGRKGLRRLRPRPRAALAP